MKFSDLLGEPEPEPESELPGTDAEPIGVFAPASSPAPPPLPRFQVPSEAPPAPPGSRNGLAELNVRPPIQEPPNPEASSVADQLTGLTEIVDDLLPSARRGRK